MQRKHITTACQICRDSKIKCDGERPVCGGCARKGRLCEYSVKDDKRKMPLRTAIDVLFGRVDKLTDLIVKCGLQLPPLDDRDREILEQVCETLELPRDKLFPPAPPDINQQSLQPFLATPVSQDTIGALDSNMIYNSLTSQGDQDLSMAYDPQAWTDFSVSDGWDQSPSDLPWQILNDSTMDFGVSSMPAQSQGPQVAAHNESKGNNVEVTGDQPSSNGSSDDEGEATIVPNLAARFGSLRVGQDGRLRYFGTACNHHLLGRATRGGIEPDELEFESAVAAALEAAGLDREVPQDLEDHLLVSFFRWHNPSHSTVDKAIFEAARANDGVDKAVYCSGSLVAVMCALGAAFGERYHASFITFPKPLSEFFADKSKVLVELELDSPCVSTVQTLTLLSSFEATTGNDARIWQYSGMAMRLAFALGLHSDSDPFVEQGLLTSMEADARKKVFWSCLVVNYLWSFNFGRPFRVDSEEVTVKLLASAGNNVTGTESSVAQQTLRSASCIDGALGVPFTMEPLETCAELSYSVLKQWVILCEQLAALIRILYGCIKISKSSLQTLSHETTRALLNWRRNLSRELQIQPGLVAAPQVLLLHMAYHYFCILVHRPWTSKSSQPRGQIGPGYKHARHICCAAASEIATLLRSYESRYGFRQMNVYAVTIIFSASLILIFALVAEEKTTDLTYEKEQSTVVGDLNTCFRALDELSQSYECAKSTKESLLAIQKHWAQCKRDAMNGKKRRTQQVRRITDGGAKRARR